MDYAFAPGSSSYDNNVKSFFRRRPNTVLVDDSKIVRVDQFIDHLETDASIVKPIENIIITAHGNDGGQMFITFADIDLDGDSSPDSVTTYEILENADASNVNDIASAIIDANTKLHIKGCKIGQAVPFVAKMKECFGATVSVSAPKFFHAIHPIPEVGILEYLGYDFGIVRKEFFKGKTARQDLISAFQAENLKFLDGITSVPNDQWTDWLPTDVSSGRRNASFRVNFSPVLKKNDGSDLATARLIIGNSFRAESQRYPYVITFSSGNAPTSRTDQESALRSNFESNPNFDSSNPFPTYERFELASIDEFIDGFKWAFSRSKNGKTLTCTGTRVLYTIVVPITTDPLGVNNLLLNISPETGNPSPIAPLVLETNTDLFLTV